MAKKAAPRPAVRRTLEQWKSQSWKTRVQAEADLRRSGVPLQGGDYALGQTSGGMWMLLDRADDVSQETEQERKEQPAPEPDLPGTEPTPPSPSAPRPWLLVLDWLPAGANPQTWAREFSKRAKKTVRIVSASETEPAGEDVDGRTKPAGATATVSGKTSRDPSPAELPAGFDDWAVEQSSRKEGVLRTELAAKAGVDRRWQGYLGDLAKVRGKTFSMKRDGRFTRFLMK